MTIVYGGGQVQMSVAPLLSKATNGGVDYGESLTVWQRSAAMKRSAFSRLLSRIIYHIAEQSIGILQTMEISLAFYRRKFPVHERAVAGERWRCDKAALPLLGIQAMSC